MNRPAPGLSEGRFHPRGGRFGGTALQLGAPIVAVLLGALCLGIVVFWGVAEKRELDDLKRYKARLEQHCGFERLQLDMLAHDLGSASSMMLNTAKLTFEHMASEDFRSIRLCMDDRVTSGMINPDDSALFCTKTFRDDIPCMRAIVRLSRFYVR